MSIEFDNALQKCKVARKDGATSDEIISISLRQGCGLIDTVKILRDTCGFDLAVGKAAVMDHPAFDERRERLDRLHQQLESCSDCDGAEESPA